MVPLDLYVRKLSGSGSEAIFMGTLRCVWRATSKHLSTMPPGAAIHPELPPWQLVGCQTTSVMHRAAAQGCCKMCRTNSQSRQLSSLPARTAVCCMHAAQFIVKANL